MLIQDVEAGTPPRNFSPMRAQPLIAWTPPRLILAAWSWLLAETGPGLEPAKRVIENNSER